MSSITKMAFRNIGRNRRRTALTGITVMVVVIVLIFMASYMMGMFGMIFDTSAKLTTGHVKIYPKGYMDKEALMPLDLAVLDSEAVVKEVSTVEGVVTVSRRIKFFTMAQVGERDEFPVLMGIEPGPEKGILEVDQNIARGRYLGITPRETVIGIGLAQKLGIIQEMTDDFEPGSAKVQIMAPRGIPMTFTVVGLFRYGFSMMDDNMMFIRFKDAQYAADMDLDDMATEVIVMLEGRDQSLAALDPITAAAATATEIEEIDVLPWQAQGFFYQMIQSMYGAMVFMLGLLFFIAASTVVNTMLMAVMERTREIGMLMSLGMKTREIVSLIVIEAMAIGVAGGLIGALIGATVSIILTHTGIPLGAPLENMPVPIGDKLIVAFAWWSVPIAFAFGLLMCLIASLWPAAKAARLAPSEALRTI